MPSAFSFTGPNGESPSATITRLTASILPTSEAMLYAGSRQITRIRERTALGNDVNGSPFAPYSPAYAKARGKSGRNVSPVDLLKSGRMLTSMRVETQGSEEFAITVQDAEAAAYGQAINDGAGHQPQRRFFDTSQAELDAMMNDLVSFTNRSL